MKDISRRFDSFLIWIVGEKTFTDQMKEMPNRLAISLILIATSISFVYIIFDIVQGYFTPIFVHTILLGGCFLVIYFFRKGSMETGKVLGLLFMELVIYLFVSAEVYDTGSHLYFVTISFAAFVVFGYEKLKVAILIAIISFILYLLTTLSDFSILPEFNFSPKTVKYFFVFNVTVFTLISSTIIILYIRMIYHQNLQILGQNEKLKQTNNELDHFLYSTSHDLRGPVASVLGLLQLIKIDNNPEEIKKCHEHIEKRVHKMDELVTAIINVVKNSRLPVQKEFLNLKEMVDQIYNDMVDQSENENILFLNQIPEKLEIESDKFRLSSILNNLLSNAIKYYNPEKEQCQIKVEGRENRNSIHIDISDNGIGIDQNHLKNIFDMFYRATEISNGVGLGLYIVSQSVKMLNGEVNVSSKSGDGTTFSLTLTKS